MSLLDAHEIGWMPQRGTPSLWPLRILTDFGKSEYVLWRWPGSLFVVAIVAPALARHRRALLLGLGDAAAVSVPRGAGAGAGRDDLIKWMIGRGRPFVGGEADVFHFSHFAGNAAYASFPSGHATTAFALAFAVAALWPQGADR